MLKKSFFEQLAIRALNLAPWPDPRFPPSPYYRFFRLLAEALRPSLSVELGLCGGGGSFHMALGWSGGRVVGVEHAVGNDSQQANWNYLLGRFPDRFVLWRGDSVDDAEKIVDIYGQPSVLFIDTTHTFAQTVAEWEAWAPLMTKRAVICLDDVQRREMAGIWDWVPWDKLRLDDLHPGGLDAEGYGDGGFGVAWRG